MHKPHGNHKPNTYPRYTEIKEKGTQNNSRVTQTIMKTSKRKNEHKRTQNQSENSF